MTKNYRKIEISYFKFVDPETVDKRRYPEYFRYFDKSKSVLKGNYGCTSDPLQIGIIEKIFVDKNEKVFLKIRAMLRPENISEDPLEICQSGKNSTGSKPFQNLVLM